MSPLSVNDTFTSYQALREALDCFEEENRVQFWKRDAKRIKSAKQYAPLTNQKAKQYPQLEYYYLKFSCIHGGQGFRPQSTHSDKHRRNRGTWKQDCPAEISVSLTKDRSALIINSITSEHNHQIPSLEEYKQLPKQRKKLGEAKHHQRTLVRRGRKPPHTSRSVVKVLRVHSSSSRSNNFRRLARLLMERYHCEVHLEMGEEDRVLGFLFQDPFMKTFFEYFPEVFYVDGTYRLLNICCSIYVLFVETSFGTMAVVGVAVLTMEECGSVEWMVDRFKEANPAWTRTRTAVADTSTSSLLQDLLPEVRVLTCQAQAFHVFKKQLRPPRLDLTKSERTECLHLIQRLIYAATEAEYHQVLNQATHPLTEYLYQHWHPSRARWCTAFAKNHRKTINNRLESPNSKLKAVIGSCRSFSEFVEKLFAVLDLRKTEFTRMTFKVPRVDLRQRYHQHLTHFAFTKIEPFLNSSKQYSLVQEGASMVCETGSKRLLLTETSCSCFFFTEVKLPCRHVLFLRKSLEMDLFDEELFSERWTKTYMRDGLMGGAIEMGGTMSEVEGVCTALAHLCAETGGGECRRSRLQLLVDLKRCWEREQEVGIVAKEVVFSTFSSSSSSIYSIV